MTPIDDKHDAFGGDAGFLGQAATPELPTPNGLGSYRHYAHGSIYWRHDLPLAFEVHGLIRERWASLGWENSFLGFPLTDEVDVPGGARANTFERGAVVWSPTTGAHEVHGEIFGRWRALGREATIGIPLTDESATPDGIGRYNHFTGGSIYWTPGTHAVEVVDPVRAPWADGGWERGALGYPTAPATKHPGSPVVSQDFQHGTLHADGVFSRTSLHEGRVVAISGTWVDWTSFGTRLPDGDVITAAFSPATMETSTITLTAGPGITWWKAVDVWSPTSGTLFEVSTQDGRRTSSIAVPAGVLERDVLLVFGKAKFLGVHTAIYYLLRADQLIGSNVTFTWTTD
jgi:hypothetical protein